MTQQVKIKSMITGRFITIGSSTSGDTWNVVMQGNADANSIWTVENDIKTNGPSEISISASAKTAYLSADMNDPVTIRGENGHKCFAHTDDYLSPTPFKFEYLGNFTGGDAYKIHILGEKNYKLATSTLNPDSVYVLDENSPGVVGNEAAFYVL